MHQYDLSLMTGVTYWRRGTGRETAGAHGRMDGAENTNTRYAVAFLGGALGLELSLIHLDIFVSCEGSEVSDRRWRDGRTF